MQLQATGTCRLYVIRWLLSEICCDVLKGSCWCHQLIFTLFWQYNVVKISCPCIWHEGLQRHGGVAVHIADVSTRWRWALSFTDGERTLHTPSTHWTGGWLGPSERVWTLGEEINLLSLPGIEPLFLGCLTHSLVTVLIELYWFFAVLYWKFCMLVMSLVWFCQNLTTNLFRDSLQKIILSANCLGLQD